MFQIILVTLQQKSQSNKLTTTNMPKTDDSFLPQDRCYRTLKCFKKAECIYDITYYFAHKFLKSNDRTIDQMVQAARFCREHVDSSVYREKIQERSDETIANIAITLIHQCDALIVGLIEWLKKDFIQKGGIKEQMYQARKDWQRRNGYQGNGGGGFGGGGHSGHSGHGGQGPTPTAPTAPTTPTPPTPPTPPTKQ